MTLGVTAILPVKPWSLSKSRLDVGHELRAELARAFTLDVLEAVCEAERIESIVLVSAELGLGAVARQVGVEVIVDRPMLGGDALNDAIAAGRRWAAVRRPGRPVVVVPSDLPALTHGRLDDAIDQLAQHPRAFIPDRAGHGTTLLWGDLPQLLLPRYGPQSSRRHAAAGVRALLEADDNVRTDVDTVTDLFVARGLGLRRHTTHVLAAHTAGRSHGRARRERPGSIEHLARRSHGSPN